MTFEQIMERAMALPAKDRLQLALAIFDSVEPPRGLSLDDPRALEEIKRRSALSDSGHAVLVNGEDAIRKLRELISTQPVEERVSEPVE